jgi:catechol 2,3-dioxygenase-like lactoylglutathione lyase family enzyme
MIQHININISDKARTREWYEKVLGAEYLDRGQELNQGQLQLRIGNAEIHSTHTPNPNPSGHFAVEVVDWEEMIANLDALEVPYSKPSIRAYSNGHSTYINDPDGNMIELVQHPLGLRDSMGKDVAVAHDPEGMAWAHMPGFGPTT